ncbi:MAG: hypothetical protein ACOXZ5_05855 [Syntrophomonadaceae bacterium]|jgi:hypothetical protein
MDGIKGRIVSKADFLKQGDYAKEEYEGLIVCADSKKGLYNLGIQLDENRILVVGESRDTDVHEKINQLAPKIRELQSQYILDDQI